MIHAPHTLTELSITAPKLPAWAKASAGETPQNTGFLSGAAFAMLDMMICQFGESVPKDLLANRLALKAAAATSKLEGRLAREGDIRDAYHLTQPDMDGVRHWGPDGEVLDFWRRAVRLRFATKDWESRLAENVGSPCDVQVTEWIKSGVEDSYRVGPMAAAVSAMKKVLKMDSRAERIACLMSDLLLARSFGWDRPLPITALYLTKAMLRNLTRGTGDARSAAEFSIQTSLLKSAQSTHRLAKDLVDRAEAIRRIAPKLRTKGSEEALVVFLSEDAVAPSGMLSPHIKGTRTPMTGRAARRLCDRLVELGVVKELTRRPTFRLYGLAP